MFKHRYASIGSRSTLALAFLAVIALPAAAATDARLSESYGKLPLEFEANRGQADKDVRFLARGAGYGLYLTPSEAVLVLTKPKAQGTSVALRMSLVGAARKPQVSGIEELPGKTNYFIGKDPAKWRTGVPTYAKVHYQNVYPGIDLVYYGKQRQLEYDFVVAPGADPRKIVLSFKGARKLAIDTHGDLVLHTAGGDIRQHKPVVYQEIDGVRQEIAGSYVRKGAGRVGFKLAAYDATRPLIIDPALAYSTYLGASGNDFGISIAADADGNYYVAGSTDSNNFPTGAGVFQAAHAGAPGSVDAFVTKLNPTGSALVYSTYLGGSGDDIARGIAVDASGNAYVTGQTSSPDLPTANAFQPGFAGGPADAGPAGPYDGLVAKLDSTGSALLYSTYLGGSGADVSFAIAVDASGNAYVTGWTRSTDFPTTPGALAVTRKGADDAFVTKLGPSGSALVYSTFLGGSSNIQTTNALDTGRAIALDASGNAYVTGYTHSSDFPTTAGAFQTIFTSASFGDVAFVTKLNPIGSALVYSTFLEGTSGLDEGYGIAVDAGGNAYVTGLTFSSDFPTTPGAFQASNGGQGDAFVTKLNPSGSFPVYSTYVGGSKEDWGSAIAVDAAGNAFVAGTTGPTGEFCTPSHPCNDDDFPMTSGAVQPVHGGNRTDAFLVTLNSSGSALIFSTYLGGSGNDYGQGLALDPQANAYMTGATSSSDFPTTAGAFQPVFAGGNDRPNPGDSFDAFVAKITAIVPPPPSATDTSRSEEGAATQIGFWTSYGAETGSFSGGSIAASNVVASSALFSFTGTAVSWIGVKCNVCGIAAVSVDGAAPTMVNTAGPGAPGGLSSEPVFSASGLATGNHTIAIVVMGMSSSGGSYVALDAFDVTAGSAAPPLLPPVVLPPLPVTLPPLPPILGF